jgi:hypothetical protein
VKRLKSLFGLAVGLMMAGSLMAPAALAQPSEPVDQGNKTVVSVTVTETGTFDAFFCGGYTDGNGNSASPGEYSSGTSLSLVQPPTLTQAGKATGTLAICYVDTLASRPHFDTYVSSDGFAGGPTSIPLSGFTVERVYNVTQTNCTCGHTPRYGDIGQYVDQGYVGQGGTWPKAWTNNNSFSAPVKLQFGYTGVGTGHSVGTFDVELDLPIATQQGNYATTLTLSIQVGTQL